MLGCENLLKVGSLFLVEVDHENCIAVLMKRELVQKLIAQPGRRMEAGNLWPEMKAETWGDVVVSFRKVSDHDPVPYLEVRDVFHRRDSKEAEKAGCLLHHFGDV